MLARGLTTVFFSIFIACIVACDRPSSKTPADPVPESELSQSNPVLQADKVVTEHSKVLRSFLEAHYAEDYKLAYSYISARDKKIRSIEQYSTDNGNSTSAMISGDQVTYFVKDVNVVKENEEALVLLEITMPDMEILFVSFMDVIADSSIKPDQTRQKVKEALDKKYPDKKYPMTTITKQYKMYKEPDGWKVFLNWEAGRYPGEQEKK